MTTSLIPVSFHDDTIYYTEKDGEMFIPMKPIIENIGLSWQPQAEKLKNGAARWGVTIIVIPSNGGKQDTLCLPFRKSLRYQYEEKRSYWETIWSPNCYS